jgi:hypothetical protein
MHLKSSGGRALEIVLFTLSSLLLYHTGIGIAFFLIPLQVVASRRGFGDFLMASGIFLAVFLGIRFAPLVLPGLGGAPDALVLLETGVVALFMVGLAVVNLPLRRRPRTLTMMGAAILGTLCVGFPGLLALSGTAPFQKAMEGTYAEVAKMLSVVFAPTADAADAGALVSTLLSPQRLREMSEAVLARTLLASYALLLAFSWWAGQAAASRGARLMGAEPGFRFSGFRLGAGWLWPLIAGWAVVLADLFFHVEPWSYAAWNVGVVMLCLYGMQGMAIVWFLFEKYRVPRFLWVLTVAGLGLCAASPGVGVFVMLAIPLFGISENWIRYRIPRDEAPREES